MQDTVNYNLKTYEPTDVANLLTGYNPSMVLIDQILKTNATHISTLESQREQFEQETSEQIMSIVSSAIAPEFAATTSAMTDTGKVYVLTSNSHMYYYNTNTNTWTDSGVVYGAGITRDSFAASLQYIKITSSNPFNVDNATLNRSYYIHKDSGVSGTNLPGEDSESCDGYLFTMNTFYYGNDTTKPYSLQFFLRMSNSTTTGVFNDIYFRCYCYSQSLDALIWNDWTAIQTSLINTIKTYTTTNYLHKRENNTYITNTENFDFNNATLNEMVFVARPATGYNRENAPGNNTTNDFYLITNNYISNSYGDYNVQIAVEGYTNLIYVRTNTNNTWHEWKQIYSAAIDNSIYRPENIWYNCTSEATSFDFNNLSLNRVCYVSSNVPGECDNAPLDTKFTGIVYNFNALYSADTNFYVQIFFGVNEYDTVNTKMKYVFARMKAYNGWMPWVKLFPADFTKANYEYIELEKKYYKALIKVGVIGDSLSTGHIENGHSQTANTIIYGWPRQIEQDTQGKWVNYGFSGATTRSWFTNNSGYNTLITDGKCQVYIIGLGVNDSAGSATPPSVPLGTIEDINENDYTQNPDTFYGNYGKIISSVQAYAPEAKFILLTSPRLYNATYTPQFNDAIRDISELDYWGANTVFLCDLEANYQYLFQDSAISSQQHGWHYTAEGYAALAEMMKRAVSDVMMNNSAFALIDEVDYEIND